MKAESTALVGPKKKTKTKKTTDHVEKERTDTDLDFFLVFYGSSSNVFVHWFRLHWFVSCIRHLFEAHLQNRTDSTLAQKIWDLRFFQVF